MKAIEVYRYDAMDYMDSTNTTRLTLRKNRKAGTHMYCDYVDGHEIGIAQSWGEAELAGVLLAPDSAKIAESGASEMMLYIPAQNSNELKSYTAFAISEGHVAWDFGRQYKYIAV